MDMRKNIKRWAAIHFDLDSFPADINNRVSGCISFDRGNFADNLRKCDRIIKRIPRNQTLSALGLDALVVLGGQLWQMPQLWDTKLVLQPVRLSLTTYAAAFCIGDWSAKTVGKQTKGVHCKLYWFDIINHQIPVQCTMFEYNSWVIDIARSNKYQPQTKTHKQQIASLPLLCDQRQHQGKENCHWRSTSGHVDKTSALGTI